MFHETTTPFLSRLVSQRAGKGELESFPFLLSLPLIGEGRERKDGTRSFPSGIPGREGREASKHHDTHTATNHCLALISSRRRLCSHQMQPHNQPMTTEPQTDLPGILSERPAQLECSGSELAALLNDLRSRGAVVTSMSVVCLGSWRLQLVWPGKESLTHDQVAGRAAVAFNMHESNQKHCYLI